jgi:hypothetical protein
MTTYFYTLDDNYLHKAVDEPSEIGKVEGDVREVTREEAAFLHAGGAILCKHPNCFGEGQTWSTT